jgi:glycosyltransferase involved in cell wall biosynthesis
LAKKYTDKIFLKGNERSQQRNYGVNVSSGQYIFYIDADMILSPTLVEDCVKKCEANNYGALYVPEKIVGHSFWIKVRDFERSFYTGTVIDAVRFIRRDLFIEVGGFDESLVGPEDWDFDRKIRRKTSVSCAELPLFHNEGNFNMKRYLRKKSYYSDGINKYILKWGPNDCEIKMQVGFRYRLITVFIEKGKWKKLLKHPLLTFGLYFLRLRVAIGFVRNKSS